MRTNYSTFDNSINTCNDFFSASVVERPTLSSLLSKKGINGALFVMGEVLFITRPLIYVLFIRKYGIRSWIPWFLSLGVDFMGFSFLSLVTNSRHGGTDRKFHLSIPENDEVRGFIFSSGSCILNLRLSSLPFKTFLLTAFSFWSKKSMLKQILCFDSVEKKETFMGTLSHERSILQQVYEVLRYISQNYLLFYFITLFISLFQ